MKIDSNNLLKLATIILIGGVILMLLSPYFLTRDWGLPSFMGTGQVGDTIGGLTAPIINLMSAVLVFLALAAQVEANRLIQKQIEDQKRGELEQKNFANLFEIYKQIKDDLDNFVFLQLITDDQHYTYKGIEAIKLFLEKLVERHCSVDGNKDEFHLSQYDSFVEILIILELLSKKIKSSKLSEVDLDTLQALTKYLFDSRIKVFLRVSNRCPHCAEKHDIYPEQFSATIEKINNNLNTK